MSAICAISTPPGRGGISVIRVSGSDSFAICDKALFVESERKLSEQEPYTLSFRKIYKGAEILDEVLVSVFRAPHSFTGENTVEISCHGSLYIQQEILKLLLAGGCRMAKAGEFTQRAFLNGKIDLSQAEAIADLIASSSAAAHRLAMNQMRGGFRDKINALRTRLLDFVSMIELELDFAEEDVEFADRNRLNITIEEISGEINLLIDSFSAGNAIKNGIPVAIAGETNAGKSTLLNLLLNEERAIVSDVHGTTRDSIEDTVTLNGTLFRFIDTAGIRETNDRVETLGIERTFRKIEQAAVVLCIEDIRKNIDEIEGSTLLMASKAKGKIFVPVLNKMDLADENEVNKKLSVLKQVFPLTLAISAKTQKGVEQLIETLILHANTEDLNGYDVIVTNLRHYEALNSAAAAVKRVKSGLSAGISGDFLAQDMRDCIRDTGEITGEITSDEILNHIFSQFCIGK